MRNKSSLLCSAAFGVMLAVGISAQAQAKVKHHHHDDGGLAAKVDSLTAAVSDLEGRLNDATQAEQATQAQAAAAQADAAQARAEAAAAQDQLTQQIQTIPGQVNSAVAAGLPKLPGGVTVKLGGFAAFETVYRTRNDVADIGSNYSKIPYLNSETAHEDELRFTARQSRLSLLVQGDINPTTHAAMYGEFDFLGAGQTANSNESNSYQPRIRNVYGTVDWDDLGLHVLAGQNWSLITMNGHGITPRSEIIPPTIEAQYVPGFVWARQPQFRVVKDFDNKQLWFGLSVENPQTTVQTGLEGSNSTLTATGVANVNVNNVGVSLLNNQVSYSENHVPDVIGKLVFEPAIGGAHPLHMEVLGIYRGYYDRMNCTTTVVACAALGLSKGYQDVNTSGGGFGGGITWTAVPNLLDLQGSVLTGTGIGRYGSGQLPDTIEAANGSLQPIPETMFLVGGTIHPTPKLDIYVMYGQEHDSTAALFKSGSNLFGYGNPATILGTGCFTEGATCAVDTQQVDQVTAGFWDKVYTGKFGQIRVGVQYSHTNLTAFSGLSASSHPVIVTPTTNDDMVFTSFRFYPNF